MSYSSLESNSEFLIKLYNEYYDCYKNFIIHTDINYTKKQKQEIKNKFEDINNSIQEIKTNIDKELSKLEDGNTSSTSSSTSTNTSTNTSSSTSTNTSTNTSSGNIDDKTFKSLI